MSEPERPEKRPPDPDALHPRCIVEGAVQAIASEGLPADGHGLGPLGEQTIHALLDEAKREQAEKRLPYLFPKYARDFFDRMHAERYDALGARIDADMEHKALWRLWKRVMLASVPIGGATYAWAGGFLDKWWPVIKRVIEAIKATST